ncbi:MAG: methionine--tRNA ligase [Patescibacteria group bacterium]|nr:methionine--tRNA ligase [Patescibacteria group bacterium]
MSHINRNEGQKFYVTTPIFYPNAKLHMGHAYSATISDIFARYSRLLGKDTYFLTGSDENTEKAVRAAAGAGQQVFPYLDGIIGGFKNLYKRLDISYDQFIRTTDKDNHWPGVEAFWKRMVDSGDIEKRSYEGLYCVGHESFITEKDLVDGKCPDHRETPQRIKEENYFFILSRYADKIRDIIASDAIRIVPTSRKNEILALLKDGLEDVSFSRPADKMTLGIPVPGDNTQKIYVWGDALTNYLTALGFGRKDHALYDRFWPADLHVIGKDILRFHAAIWPGMLLSAGLPLPKNILVHGLITSGGLKMSKTLGNVIDPVRLIDEYGADAVRYFVARHISPFEDGDMTMDSFKEAYNAGLANGIGNLVSRILKLTSDHRVSSDLPSKEDVFADETVQSYAQSFDEFDIQKACNHIWTRIASMDREIQETQPFKLVKSADAASAARGKAILSKLYRELWIVAVLLEPIIPATAATIQGLIRSNKMPSAPLFARK